MKKIFYFTYALEYLKKASDNAAELTQGIYPHQYSLNIGKKVLIYLPINLVIDSSKWCSKYEFLIEK